MSSPQAVIFDNDGLLLDTEESWTRAERTLFERRGFEFTLEHKRELLGTGAQDLRGGRRHERQFSTRGSPLRISAHMRSRRT